VRYLVPKVVTVTAVLGTAWLAPVAGTPPWRLTIAPSAAPLVPAFLPPDPDRDVRASDGRLRGEEPRWRDVLPVPDRQHTVSDRDGW
jgi:hypothetical protein